MSNTAIKVAVSGAAGQICYSLIPLLSSGSVFGPNVRLDIRLLDIEPAQEALKGVRMEMDDCSFTLIDRIVETTDLQTSFQDVDVAILVGGFPRKQGMLRKDLISKNVAIFQAQGKALEAYASRDVKVLVVANPANTNCLITMKNAPSIPKENFSALTRLDHERMRSMIVNKVNSMSMSTQRDASDVRQCIIWGNHSSTQFPDARFVEIRDPVTNTWQKMEAHVQDLAWSREELVQLVQQRGAAVIAARKLSSAMSAASAIAAHLRTWKAGSDEYVSMAIHSEKNPYQIADDLIFSFPVVCSGNWQRTIVGDLDIDVKSKERMTATGDELLQERADAMAILNQ